MLAIVQSCEAPDTAELDAGLKEEHSNPTRTIFEIIDDDGLRRTRHDFHLAGAPAGEHWHTGTENFIGRGRGTLYTLPKDAPEGTEPEMQTLPPGWWEVEIPAGLVHTFVFNRPPADQIDYNEKGQPVIAELYSRSGFVFENGVNTFPRKLTNLAKVT